MMIPHNMRKVPRALKTMSKEECDAFRKGYVEGYNVAIKRMNKNKIMKE